MTWKLGLRSRFQGLKGLGKNFAIRECFGFRVIVEGGGSHLHFVGALYPDLPKRPQLQIFLAPLIIE